MHSTPQVSHLLHTLEEIEAYSQTLSDHLSEPIAQSHPTFRASLKNLIHYLALRRHDIRELQNGLGQLGISRLGKAESHVMASITAVKQNLERILGKAPIQVPVDQFLSFDQGKQTLQQHAEALLGSVHEDRRVRIMVTLPSEAATNYDLVHQLLEAGVNCARINCAHDSAVEWEQMIEHVRQAEAELGVSCKVSMDLGGPKLRTGPIEQGPEVLKIKTLKDESGKLKAPGLVSFYAELPEEALPGIPVPVSPKLIKAAKEGDLLLCSDAREKTRKFKVLEKSKHALLVQVKKTTYLESDTSLRLYRGSELIANGEIGTLPALEKSILLKIGDELVIHQYTLAGEAARFNKQGVQTQLAHISCALPELYAHVNVGERVLMDDGKIEGVVEKVLEKELRVRITFTRPGGANLKADKGINLPDSELHLRGLTAKDKQDLPFVVQHADILNMSFVNETADIEDLLSELARLGAKESLGIILKIETQKGFQNLPGILIQAMRKHPLGVMIARGDLAVECGWNRLAEVQEEILRLCEAAHVPIVWATQVLESLAKKGQPSRAEITDAAMAQRAECVMLNKGPFIVDTIQLLDAILKSMQPFQQKKAPMLPVLAAAEKLE